MRSDDIIIEAPLSLTGSAKRLWRLSKHPAVRVLVTLPLIGLAWAIVLTWYAIFGLWLVPYRLIRRSQRKQRQAQLRHQELLYAVTGGQR